MTELEIEQTKAIIQDLQHIIDQQNCIIEMLYEKIEKHNVKVTEKNKWREKLKRQHAY